MPGPRSSDRVVKRRPKDRKAQIARASADAFSALGYHAVSMEDIARRVDISAAALYRHSASKYQLFRDAVLTLGQQLVDCTEFLDHAPVDGDPETLRAAAVSALIETTVANRSSGGLYRWEGRYLTGDDQATLMQQVKLVNRRLQKPLAVLRPTLSSRQRWTISAATLSVIGSIADHHAQLPAEQITAVLSAVAAAVAVAELPDIPAGQEHSPRERPLPQDRADALLQASMALFSAQGYRETSMEEIAAAVGIPASGIYRFFPGKAELLAASFYRAADRISADIADIAAAQLDPEHKLLRLIAGYVTRSFDEPELAFVYYTERLNLTPDDRDVLRDRQRDTVDYWTRVLTEARPELSSAAARFVVHAALALTVDLGRLV